MKLEERCFGLPLTPEVASMVENVFDRRFAHMTAHVDHVRVRLSVVPDGVECRAMLRPSSGATLAIRETRPSTMDAVMASASALAHQLERRVLARSRRTRHHHATARGGAQAVA